MPEPVRLLCFVEIPKGQSQQVRVGPGARGDQARPVSLLLCRLPHRLRLPSALRDEIAHFFSIYKQPEGKTVAVEGWAPREAALARIAAAQEAWRSRRG